MCHDVVCQHPFDKKPFQFSIAKPIYIYLSYLIKGTRLALLTSPLALYVSSFRNTCQYDRSGEINLALRLFPAFDLAQIRTLSNIENIQTSNTIITCHTVTKYLAWKNMSPCKAPITFAFDLPSCPRPKRV